MARITTAQLQAALAAAEARAQGAEQALADLQSRLRHDYVDIAEYRRVQGVLRTTQQFYAKVKRGPRVDTSRPFSERCRAYLEATGERSVTAPQLIEWEQAQAAH